MTKNQAIQLINEAYGFNQLHITNTHWSNIIKYRAEEGWWLNIPFHKFTQDLNLILNNETSGLFIHIKIPANSIADAENQFRNKLETADIFMPNSGKNRLIDCQSGSTKHDFSQYPIKQYQH